MQDKIIKSVLLVYPGKKKYSTGTHSENYFPMGLLYVASEILPLGINVEYLNMLTDDFSELPPKDYLFVGFTVLTGEMILYALNCARFIKKNNPNVPVIFGGVHATILPEQTLENELVDFVVIGEGEDTVKELIAELLNERKFKDIKGIGYKENGKIIINSKRNFIDLNKTRIDLPYDIFGINNDNANLGAFPVHTSRGCPYRCSFCYNASVNKRSYRTKNAFRVVEEIEYLINKYDVRIYSFGNEDEFFIDVKRVKEILQQMVEKNLKTEWGAFCRFDTLEKIDKNYLELIKESGGKILVFGGESGSQRLLDGIIKKDITIEQMLNGVKKLKKAEILHIVSFIAGFPTETIQDLKDTFELIERMYFENPFLWVQSIYLLTPMPGTELYNLLVNNYNYTPPGSLEEWGQFEMPIRNWNYMTWHDKKYAKLCYDIHNWSTYNPFYYLNDYNNRHKNLFQHRRAPYFINKIIGKIQRIRIKYLFFKFPIEHILYLNSFGLITIYTQKKGIFYLIYNIRNKLMRFAINTIKFILPNKYFQKIKRLFK